MRTVAIIAEYNPFHNGHQYHIQQAKKQLNADFALVIMSGNFVQRGEPAIIHKWKRTEMCLLGGADLVLELPVAYATASAEYFAAAAVRLTNQTGIVSHLSFGAESGALNELQSIADILCIEPPDYQACLKEHLGTGRSFPSARAAALKSLLPSSETLLASPNNILAIEYLKALQKTESAVKPHMIKRTASDYHARKLEGSFSSATAIRAAIKAAGLSEVEHCIPAAAYAAMAAEAEHFPIDIDDYSDMLLYRIKTMPPEQLQRILDISEGLEHRIYSASHLQEISSIIAQIKTKRYTFTKIQRIFMHILLNITTEQMRLYENAGGPQYLRVLGFRKDAEPLLQKLARTAALPLVINLKKDQARLNGPAAQMLAQEIAATNIYFIKSKSAALRAPGIEYTFPPIIV